ncbi:hypothetical protein NDN08_003606 [Rhodosorus marinus]|uniref:Myb-like domain-containing protein n=1 Tax=Rhodosorus marinus TaxID=101924 RepID=A0AAV8UX98_9RHOD|nr:hypothetical protein NDN08_003606 [Rhodosorus marinus]
MDRLFSACADVVSTAGPGGILLEKALETARRSLKSDSTAGDEKADAWIRQGFEQEIELFSVRRDKQHGHVHVTACEQLIHYALGFSLVEQAARPKLTMKILYEIGRTREVGILQSDLPKLVGIPSHTVHHHVQSLFAGGLISREKGVFVRKGGEAINDEQGDDDHDSGKKLSSKLLTSTVVLKLSRFSKAVREHELDHDDSLAYTQAVQLDVLGKRVIEILEENSGCFVTVKELKRRVIPGEGEGQEATLHERRHRIWRNLRTRLLKEGRVVEEERPVTFSNSNKKHILKCFRLSTAEEVKKKPGKCSMSSEDENPDLTVAELDPLSLVYSYMLQKREAGVTVPELFKVFGEQIERKHIALLVETLGSSEEVAKVTEHVGKQLFIRHVLKRFDSEQNQRGVKEELEESTVVTDGPLLGRCIEEKQRHYSSLTLARESKVLELVQQHRIMRMDRIGRLLAEAEAGNITRVDTKVVRRILKRLESQGKIKLLEVPQPGFAGKPSVVRLVCAPGIEMDSEHVEQFFADTMAFKAAKEVKQEAQVSRAPTGVDVVVSDATFRHENIGQKVGLGMLIARLHGLIQGKLLRAKALHLEMFHFIEARESHKGETKTWECSFTVGEVIEELSVDEYMKVIGVYENLGPITAEERLSKVRELPMERKHGMIHRRGSANQVVKLLDILKRVGLVENSWHRYKLSMVGAVRDFGKGLFPFSSENVAFRTEGDILKYWETLENIGTKTAEQPDSIKSAEAATGVESSTETKDSGHSPGKPYLFPVPELYVKGNWRSGRMRRVSPPDAIRMETAFAKILENRRSDAVAGGSGLDIRELSVEDIYQVVLSTKVSTGDLVAYYKHRLQNSPFVRASSETMAISSALEGGSAVSTKRPRGAQSSKSGGTKREAEANARMLPDADADSSGVEKSERKKIRRRPRQTQWTEGEELRLLVNVVQVKADKLRLHQEESGHGNFEFWPEVAKRMRASASACRARFGKLLQKDNLRHGVSEAIRRIQAMQNPDAGARSGEPNAFDVADFFRGILDGRESIRVDERGEASITLLRDTGELRDLYSFLPFSPGTLSATNRARPATREQIGNKSCVLREVIKALLRTPSQEYDPVVGAEIMSKFSGEEVQAAFQSLRQSQAISSHKDNVHSRAYSISATVKKALGESIFNEPNHSNAKDMLDNAKVDDGYIVDAKALSEGGLLMLAQAVANGSLTLTPVGLQESFTEYDLEEMELLGDKRSSNRAPKWRVHVASNDLEVESVDATPSKRPDDDPAVQEAIANQTDLKRVLEIATPNVDLAVLALSIIRDAGDEGVSTVDMEGKIEAEIDRTGLPRPTKEELGRALSSLESVGSVVRLHCDGNHIEGDSGAWLLDKIHAKKFSFESAGLHPVRPWMKLRGDWDDETLRGLQVVALSLVLEKPGIDQGTLVTNLRATDIPHRGILDALAALEHEGRISRRVVPVPTKQNEQSYVADRGLGDAEFVGTQEAITTYHPTLDAYPMSGSV